MDKGPISSNNHPSLRDRLLGKYLPNRTKRLVFISSFLAHIKVCNYTDLNLIKKINELLHLSGNNNALRTPMQFHDKIWSDVDIDEILANKGISLDQIDQISFMSPKVRTLSEDIIKAMPNWLRYDSNTQMRSDLIALFKNIGTLKQTQQTTYSN